MAKYRVKFTDGETVDFDNVERCETTGSSTKLFNSDGHEVASFRDGEVKRCYIVTGEE